MLSFRFMRPNATTLRKLPRFTCAAMGLALIAGLGIQACVFEWDSYDPRLGSNVGGSGGTGADGGQGGAGGGMSGPCGNFDLLAENFDAPLDTDWTWDMYSDPNLVVTQLGGQLVFQMSSTTAVGDYAALDTSRLYDLRDNSISVEVVSVPNPMTVAQAGFSVVYETDTDVGMHYVYGEVKFGYTKAGTFAEKGKFTHDPAMTRFWRMRENAGAFYWESSPDGLAWKTQGQAPTNSVIPAAIGSLRFDAYVPENVTAPGEARFDNLRGEKAPEGRWCAANTLQDDFDDSITSHAWARARDEAGCTYAETGGRLVLKPSTIQSARCGYVAAASYDLTSTSVFVEAAQMVDTTVAVDMRLSLESPTGRLRIQQYMGNLIAGYVVEGNAFDLATLPYEPANHRWWRIREADGTTYWDVSGDGSSWNELANAPNPFDPKALDIRLSVGTSGTIANPGEAQFDNFNLAP